MSAGKTSEAQVGQTYNGATRFLGSVTFRVTRINKSRVQGLKTWQRSDGSVSTFPTSMTHRQFSQMIGRAS